MGKLTVVTWNSAGETRGAARGLAEALDTLAGNGRTADVIVVQGTGARPNGPVHRMLAGLGKPYHAAPAHATEGGADDRGYLLLTRDGIGGQHTFHRADLATDPGLRRWLGGLPGPEKASAEAQLAAMGMPATAMLCVGATTVRLLTWRVPRGPGRLLPSVTLSGGANPDALLLYQQSGLATVATARSFGLFAGDLGVTADAFNAGAGFGPLRCLLPGYGGVASGLQYLIGHGRLTRPDPGMPITMAEYVPVSGHVHAVLCATATWQSPGPVRRIPPVRCRRVARPSTSDS